VLPSSSSFAAACDKLEWKRHFVVANSPQGFGIEKNLPCMRDNLAMPNAVQVIGDKAQVFRWYAK
jgi:hypothetical protein